MAEIFDRGYLADKVIQRAGQSNRRWGSHDRRQFAELTYGCVRWRRRLSVALAQDHPRFEDLVLAYCSLNKINLQAAIVPLPARLTEKLRSRWDDAALTRAERESLPDWLDEAIARQLGPRWDEVLPVLNEPAPVFLRANALKISAPQLVASLAKEGILGEDLGPETIRLARRVNVHSTKAFQRGEFEVQDWHSQMVAGRLDPKPGECVIDACAGAGGKTLHIAARMRNKGKLIAMDVVGTKLEELRRRATRAGATSIETRVIENRKVIKRLHGRADRVLLDVPCTGLGVWRRNPDAKWRLSVETIAKVGQLQRDILADYPMMVKPGGVLVYATCSVLPEENQNRLRAWLSQNATDWELESEETLWPTPGGGDGFYVARLRRRPA